MDERLAKFVVGSHIRSHPSYNTEEPQDEDDFDNAAAANDGSKTPKKDNSGSDNKESGMSIGPDGGAIISTSDGANDENKDENSKALPAVSPNTPGKEKGILMILAEKLFLKIC